MIWRYFFSFPCWIISIVLYDIGLIGLSLGKDWYWFLLGMPMIVLLIVYAYLLSGGC